MTGISRLGYLGFQVSDLCAWERFAVEVLGLVVAERKPDGGLALRMDDQAQRIILHPGPRDDLLYAGFEVDDEGTLRRLSEELNQGWGGRKLDDTHWQVGHYDRMSTWGHHLPGSIAG